MPITSQKQIKVTKDVNVENGYYKESNYLFIKVEDTQTIIIHVWQDSTMIGIRENNSMTVGDWEPCTQEDYEEAVVKSKKIITKIYG